MQSSWASHLFAHDGGPYSGCPCKSCGTDNIFFANLASFGTGNSDKNGNLVFDQVIQVRSRLIAGGGDDVVDHAFLYDHYPVIRQEKTYLVACFVGGLGQLKRRVTRVGSSSPRVNTNTNFDIVPLSFPLFSFF